VRRNRTSRKTHALQQAVEPWIVAQRVEPLIVVVEDHPAVPPLVRAFEPIERRLVVASMSIQRGDLRRLDKARLRAGRHRFGGEPIPLEPLLGRKEATVNRLAPHPV
jgi:hypothetical protein